MYIFSSTKNIHSGFGGMAIINNNLDFDKAKYIYEEAQIDQELFLA